MPKISIIIPTYNRANVIGRTIESFISQTYKEWELLVVDDHSTDNTAVVIETFMAKDARIKYYLNERSKGAQGARNTEILKSTAEWVVLFDSDDYAYPDYLSSMVCSIDNSVDVISCDAQIVNVNNNQKRIAGWGAEGYIERKLMTGEVYVNFNSAIIRKSKLIEIGLLDESCPCFQEFDTHLRLSVICTYKQIHRVLLDYSWGGIDAISYDKRKNNNGYCYVMWHNRERWRMLELKSFVRMATKKFRRVDWETRKLLLESAPELIFYLPLEYFQAIKRFVSRLLRKS